MDLETKRKAIECLDMMERRLDKIEAQRARDDAEDDLADLMEEGNTFPTPQQPFAAPPQQIHGSPESRPLKRDLFA